MWLGGVVNEQCVVVSRTASNAKWKTKTGSLFTAPCTEDAVYSKTTQKELNKNIMNVRRRNWTFRRWGQLNRFWRDECHMRIAHHFWHLTRIAFHRSWQIVGRLTARSLCNPSKHQHTHTHHRISSTKYRNAAALANGERWTNLYFIVSNRHISTIQRRTVNERSNLDWVVRGANRKD